MSYDIVTHLERLGSGASDDHSIASEGAEEILRLRAEVEKLRALCAARPPVIRYGAPKPIIDWMDKIDAAGHGEG